jgi:SAM-dependent methyltransferase
MSAKWTLPIGDYQGLPMRCAPMTHESAAALLAKHNIKTGPVLDVASGSGALLARLRDLGYAGLHAIELDREKFRLPDINPRPLDLNKDFAPAFGDQRFNLITAIEIIEHLDDPRHFLRQLRQLLADDGHLILSTPNIANWVGRVKFLLRGEIRYFDEPQYDFNHHITPISHTQMRLLLREVGYDLIDHVTAGSFDGPLKRAIFAPLRACFRILTKGAVDGEVNIYLARRAASERSSRPTDWVGT